MSDISNGLKNLQLGGTERKEGWINLNINPGTSVDVVGTCDDLSMFADGSFDVVYASHVLEHVTLDRAFRCMREVWRVLAPEGQFMVSVPDVLQAASLLSRAGTPADKFLLMKIIYGGGVDEYDHHQFGYDLDMLKHMLGACGFRKATRVKSFDIFRDNSCTTVNDIPISLNVIAAK